MPDSRILRFLSSLIAPILIVGVVPLWLIHNRLAGFDTRWPAGSVWVWTGEAAVDGRSGRRRAQRP